MGRRKKNTRLSPNAEFVMKEDSYTIKESNRTIESDELIKISGEHGKKFRFKSYVLRTDTGIEWIECVQIEKGLSAGWRFFRPDRIKPLPKSRRAKKNLK